MRGWALSLMIGASACGGVKENIYLLTPPATVAGKVTTKTIDLLPVTVPDYLDTTDIQVRTGQYDLVALPHARWGERLSQGVTRALATDLSARLPQLQIVTRQPGEALAPQLAITIDAFDLREDGSAILNARWTLSGHPPGHAGVIVAWHSTSPTDVVETMTRALGLLADRIVVGVFRY